jgi:hypothetical protein
MALGMPIVCFQGAAHGFVHGETALLSPDGDIEAFASETLRLMEDSTLRAALGAAAREHVGRVHTIAAAGAQLGNALARHRPVPA